MCCFSGPARVADTNIFARPAKDDRQCLVYSMSFAAKADLAMILPLPVPKAPKEHAIRFINLEKYPDLFKDLRRGFPSSRGTLNGGSKGDDKPDKLVVVEVGGFEASFVP